MNIRLLILKVSKVKNPVQMSTDIIDAKHPSENTSIMCVKETGSFEALHGRRNSACSLVR